MKEIEAQTQSKTGEITYVFGCQPSKECEPEAQPKAMRYNKGKLEWSLVDFKAFEPMVKVLMFGAKKYSPNNWKKGLPQGQIIDSLMRHLVDLHNGKVIDEESKELIIGHILCNAMFLSHFIQKNLNEKDPMVD